MVTAASDRFRSRIFMLVAPGDRPGRPVGGSREPDGLMDRIVIAGMGMPHAVQALGWRLRRKCVEVATMTVSSVVPEKGDVFVRSELATRFGGRRIGIEPVYRNTLVPFLECDLQLTPGQV